jgi:hypothetical protein
MRNHGFETGLGGQLHRKTNWLLKTLDTLVGGMQPTRMPKGLSSCTVIVHLLWFHPIPPAGVAAAAFAGLLCCALLDHPSETDSITSAFLMMTTNS